MMTERRIELKELSSTTPAALLDAARGLMLEYGRFVLAQPGAARFCFGTLQEEASALPHSFLSQGGGSFLALVDGEPMGFVAWRALQQTSVVEAGAWELKRLWVRPLARGLSLGRQLSQAVIDRASAARRPAIYLDTAPASMGAAHRLYLALGFEPCPPYNDNRVEDLAYLRKPLSPA